MKIVKFVQDVLKVAGLTFALILGLGIVAYAATRPSFTEKSIVKVLNFEGTGGGTGWVAYSGGKKVIVTNDHVCAVETGGFVRIESDDGTPALKRVLKRNFERDLCVVDGVDAPALTIASKPAKRFDKVSILGHPGLRPTAPATGTYTGAGIIQIGFNPDSSGNCPAIAEVVNSLFGSFCVVPMEIGYTTVPIMPGNSGSPVTNESGEVIGVMNSADSTGNQGMFIPLNYLKDMLAN